MKNIVVVCSLFALLMIAGSAEAQENGIIGLYFDPLGDVDCLDANEIAPYSQVTIYLIIKDPTFDALYGFEAGIAVEGPAIMLNTIFPNPQALNVGSDTNLIVGLGSPSIMEEINILAELTALYTSASHEGVCFKLAGSEPSSIDPMSPVLLLADGQLMLMPQNHGPYAECTAWIQDGPCGVPTTARTWDSLKTLYR